MSVMIEGYNFVIKELKEVVDILIKVVLDVNKDLV